MLQMGNTACQKTTHRARRAAPCHRQKCVFEEPADYAYFEELMCFYAKSFGIAMYNYCLMCRIPK